VPARSAGLLLHRAGPEGPEVLIAHMGGPFWRGREAGAWSIPKGEHGDDEDPLQAARREFAEEIGRPPPEGPVTRLGEFRQAGGKRVTVFALAGDMDVTEIHSATFEVELPRGSGRMVAFPEIDRAAWVTPARARELLVGGQVPALDALLAHLDAGTTGRR
jgi:predicted NUDIX family NTP pyrophosphohydrolase